MSLEIYVDAYSGYKANERPRQFTLDEDTFEIEVVEEQWRSPDAAFFKVRTSGGKHYVLRYDDTEDQWTLQSDFDGAELLAQHRVDQCRISGDLKGRSRQGFSVGGSPVSRIPLCP
jgi:hypothetical protein